ncbi:hypothetical protein diail_9762 [Diaporthe ilicicola]|nr:hypothetical protein diail_9762 [Diaporthe ilicicola]
MSDRTAWGEKAHLDLLLAVLNNVNISSSDWESKILPELRAKGYSYTVSAALGLVTTIMSTPTKGPTFKWDDASDRDLFAACLIAAGEPKGATLAKAMDILKDNFGERFTKKAASHRLQHLQKLKRKEGSPVKKAATPSKKRGKAATEDSDEETSPKKKRKTPVKSAPVPASSAQDDEEDDNQNLVKDEADEDEF